MVSIPASSHVDVINRAKTLYTEKGLSPKEILEHLALDLELGELLPGKLPEDARLPSNRSSINRWAEKFGWTPHGERLESQESGQSQKRHSLFGKLTTQSGI